MGSYFVITEKIEHEVLLIHAKSEDEAIRFAADLVEGCTQRIIRAIDAPDSSDDRFSLRQKLRDSFEAQWTAFQRRPSIDLPPHSR